MELNEKTKQILIYAVISIVIVSGIVFYAHYNFNSMRQDYNLKIALASNTILSSLKQVEAGLRNNLDVLGQQIDSVNESLGIEVSSMKKSLNDFRQQNQKELDTLSTLIEQIEQQSNIQLNEIKSDLKDIQIKSADFSAIIDDVLLSVVSVTTQTGVGSGAVIKEGGYIVTNYHVVQGSSLFTIARSSGAKYNAQFIGYEPNADVAVLKVNANLPVLQFGNSNDVKVGTKVIALGSPAGLSFTVTEGIISAVRNFPNGLSYLQTDVPINPGNSGGPLIDQKGEIIGINNFKVKGFESLGFAISSNDALQIANAIISEYEAKNK